jgi:Piwi domain
MNANYNSFPKKLDKLSSLAKNTDVNQLHINIIPIEFNRTKFALGRVEYVDEDHYTNLRNQHRKTHVFRFDKRDQKLVNISISPEILPLGEISSEEAVQDHLFLLGKAFQHCILEWLRNHRTILKRGRPLIFWGNQREAKLLSQAIEDCNLIPKPGLEVNARYSFDTRIFQVPNKPEESYLALLIELSTSNVLDIPLNDLLKAGLDLKGKYVCRRSSDAEDMFRPRSELLGAVAEIEENVLLLTDCLSNNRVSILDVSLEPRQENIESAVQVLYPDDRHRILERLQQLRKRYTTANDKLHLIQQTLEALRNKHTVATGDGLTMQLTEMLTPKKLLFPKAIEVSRPNLLFGSQGRNTSLYPDPAIQQWGPFKYMHNEKNEPVIAILCEAPHRGRMEQFIQNLCHGFPDEAWEAATSWQIKKQENPYQGGLIGKFHVGKVVLEYEEVSNPDAKSYRHAAKRLLERLSKAPDLAVVQVRQSFKFLYGEQNPYFVCKAAFMQAGVPVQAIQQEKIESTDYQLPWILNSMGLACYAKLGGIPWVISTRSPTSHELVIGMGYTEVGTSRLGEKNRYVGITTLFQGDGRYQVWGLTREVEFDNYAEALLENLRTTIRHIREKNDWQIGDSVRLIFHVYKPLKYKEMDAIKKLVADLISDQYEVKFAFIDISQYHPIQLFDPRQPGQKYRSGREDRYKGIGVPERGIARILDERTAILNLTGPGELKTDYQGLPRPLKIELHDESNFDDLTYLVRQIYHFTYMSWRSFSPSTEPITIAYSGMISRALGNLKPIEGWNSSVLTVGSLRNSMWFL